MAIKNQYQYKKTDAELRALESLRALRPFLWLLGSKGRSTARIMGSELPKLRRELDRLRNLPDRFNETFSEHGWIASDDMNVDAMEESLRLASEVDIEAAENHLEEHFNKDAIGTELRRFCYLPEIAPRRDLLDLAWEDHRASRYHASVPIILAQIDGITWDLTSKTFYGKTAERTMHLLASQTIAGDPDGLATLAQLVSQERRSTIEGPISVPYRHGILHGRDLGYSNRRTSTKAFAMLLALRPWVLKIRNGEQFLEPPIDYFDPDTASWEDIKAGWRRTLKTFKELGDIRRERKS